MPTRGPGWNRRCASPSAPSAGRRAISGAATWRSLSISRRLILSAEAARDPCGAQRTGAWPPVTVGRMFKVQANSPDEYFDAGAPAGGPGMRMNLIGYGCFECEVNSGQQVKWPIVGLALQQNDISLYTSVVQDGAPITDRYKGSLGELKTGRGNFSFVTFDQLDRGAVVTLLKDIDKALRQDPTGALRTGRTASCRRR
jgi:hypothetical protein